MDAIVDASVPAILVFFTIVAIGSFVGYRLRWALLFSNPRQKIPQRVIRRL
jgi:hypothetical protein